MSQASFILTYDGPALDTHEMAARDLAPALIAVSNVLEQANFTLRGEHARIMVSVRASFRTGSFGIDFTVVQNLASQALQFFNSDKINAAINLLELVGFAGGTVSAAGGGLLWLLRKLRGRPIRNVIQLENGRFQIIVEEDRYETELMVLELLRNYELRRAIEEALAKPLEREGVERVAVQASEQSEPFVINADERAWYSAPPPEEQELDDTTVETFLQLVNVAFKEDNKWRFSDGATTFYAAILDQAFLSRVERDEERFGKNDLFKVRLHRRYLLESTGLLRQEAEILEVLEHRPGNIQLRLPISNADENA